MLTHRITKFLLSIGLALSFLFSMGCTNAVLISKKNNGSGGDNKTTTISVSPSTATTSVGYPITLMPQGGTAPYSFAIKSGGGSVSASGTYSPNPLVSGNTEIEITDANGNKATSSIYSHGLNINGSIQASAIDNNNLYIGGTFTSINTGFQANGFIKLDSQSGAPDVTCDFRQGLVGTVETILNYNNNIYIGGTLSSYKGIQVQNLIKVDYQCNLDTTFTQTGNGFNSTVRALAINSSNNSIYVGGTFTGYRGIPNNAQYLAKLNLDSGNLDSTFSLASSGFNSHVYALAINVTTNSIYVGGNFTSYRGGSSNAMYLAKLALDTGNLDTAFTIPSNGFDNNVYTLAINSSNNSLYVGGSFTAYKGGTNNTQYLAKVDLSNGTLDTTFTVASNGFNLTVNSLAINLTNNAIYVGGNFTSYRGGSNNTKYLAKLDLDSGNLDTVFTQTSSGFNFLVNSLVINSSSNSIYVGGNFTSYRGGSNNTKYLAKLDLDSGNLDTSFILSNNAFDSWVHCLSIDPTSNVIYAGGSFTQYRGFSTNANNLAKIDLNSGSLDINFTQSTGFNNSVNTIAVNPSNSSVYVGGSFSSYRGNTALYLAKIDSSNGNLDTTFTQTSGLNGAVTSIAIYSTSIYLGGTFTTYKTVAAQRLAKLDLTTGALDTTFTPTTGFNNYVYTLAINPANNSIYVGGTFTSYNGISPIGRLAKLDLATGIMDTSFTTGSGFNGAVQSLAVDNSTNSLYVGGAFTQYQGVTNSSKYLAKLDWTTGVLDTTFTLNNNGFNAAVYTLAVDQISNSLYIGGIFTQYRGTPNNALKLTKVDLTSGALDPTFSVTSQGIDNSNVQTISINSSATSPVLFVGGNFTSYRSQLSQFGILLDPSTGNKK